jgi:hypothetical protein
MVSKYTIGSYDILIAWVVIVPADKSEAICDIRPSNNHGLHKASDHRVVYDRITEDLVRLPQVTLRSHRHGNWPRLVHSEYRHGRSIVGVLMDVDCVMHPIAFDVHAAIGGDRPEIRHLEPRLHYILHRPNQAAVSNDEEIISLQNDCSNNNALICIMDHEQCSVNPRGLDSNRDQVVPICAVPNVRELLQARKTLSPAQYHQAQSLC